MHVKYLRLRRTSSIHANKPKIDRVEKQTEVAVRFNTTYEVSTRQEEVLALLESDEDAGKQPALKLRELQSTPLSRKKPTSVPEAFVLGVPAYSASVAFGVFA